MRLIAATASAIETAARLTANVSVITMRLPRIAQSRTSQMKTSSKLTAPNAVIASIMGVPPDAIVSARLLTPSESTERASHQGPGRCSNRRSPANAELVRDFSRFHRGNL